MANSISNSVTLAGAGGAAIVTTAGGPGGAPPVTIAAFQNADVLVVAMPHCHGSGGGNVAVPARRPTRPTASAGWAQPTIYTAVGTTKKPATSTATKKTTSTSSTSTSKTATSTTKSSSASTAKSSGPLAFLDDKNLSVEEKLFRFLCYVADKNEKALEKKLEEISGKQKATSAGTSSSKSTSTSSGAKSSGGGGGLLGSLLGGGAGGLLGGLAGGGGPLGAVAGGILGGGGGGGLLGMMGGTAGGFLGILGGGAGGGGGLLGAFGPMLSGAGLGGDLLNGGGLKDLVSQLAGPVLAAGASVMGFPMLAPLAMQLGPTLANGAMSLLDGAAGGEKTAASGASGGASSSSSASKSSSSSGSSSAAKDPDISQKDLMEIQRLQDKQKEAFSMISNMLRAMHDTKMAVISNLRA